MLVVVVVIIVNDAVNNDVPLFAAFTLSSSNVCSWLLPQLVCHGKGNVRRSGTEAHWQAAIKVVLRQNGKFIAMTVMGNNNNRQEQRVRGKK